MFVIGVAVLFVTHLAMLALGFFMGVSTVCANRISKEDVENER